MEAKGCDMMYDPIALANNIKTFRQALGLSQGDLASRLSVSTQSVSKWECGNSVPDISNLCALSELLSVSVDTLLGNSPTQKKMYIGVDGGGSKTEFVSFDQNGILLDRLVLGPCNPNAIGVSATVSLLCTGIDRLCANRAELGGVYVGSAGFLLGDNARDIRAALKKSYPHVKIKCNTDILNVVAGCTDEENCLAVICGTGSTVCVKEGEALTRLTGWGYLLSKSGSGFDIGRDALFAALRECGFAPKRITFVYRTSDHIPSLVLTEAKRGGKEGLYCTPPLFLTDSEGNPSKQYTNILEKGEFDEQFRLP